VGVLEKPGRVISCLGRSGIDVWSQVDVLVSDLVSLGSHDTSMEDLDMRTSGPGQRTIIEYLGRHIHVPSGP
jgi:hypothetical protein